MVQQTTPYHENHSSSYPIGKKTVQYIITLVPSKKGPFDLMLK